MLGIRIKMNGKVLKNFKMLYDVKNAIYIYLPGEEIENEL